MEREEERRAELETNAATKRLRLAIETEEERKARLEKMVATKRLRLAEVPSSQKTKEGDLPP